MKDKYLQMLDLLLQVHDPTIARFLDIESEDQLDDKIEVLTDLKEGKTPAQIPKYYSILPDMDKEQHWD